MPLPRLPATQTLGQECIGRRPFRETQGGLEQERLIQKPDYKSGVGTCLFEPWEGFYCLAAWIHVLRTGRHARKDVYLKPSISQAFAFCVDLFDSFNRDFS